MSLRWPDGRWTAGRWTAGVLAGALVLAAASCGDDDTSGASSVPAPADSAAADGAGSAEAGSYAVEAANGPVSLDAQPERIVVLSPTHTEILFAIGAGPQVIAVDDQSNYPPESAAVKTDLSSYEPNVEAIVGYEPDLVVISEDRAGLVDQLGSLDVPVWSGPAATTFDDVYTQIEQLGVLTGNVGEAAELVAQMEADLVELSADLPTLPEPLTYYHELDNTYYTASSQTFIGQVYELMGLRNIADAAEDASDYPQLSAELIISADPDLIFLADADYGESPETVAARPAWDQISAVVNGHVIPVSADLASRWGPRVVDYVRLVRDAVAAVAAQQPVG